MRKPETHETPDPVPAGVAPVLQASVVLFVELLRYTGHDETCLFHPERKRPCSCGLEQARAGLLDVLEAQAERLRVVERERDQQRKIAIGIAKVAEGHRQEELKYAQLLKSLAALEQAWRDRPTHSVNAHDLLENCADELAALRGAGE